MVVNLNRKEYLEILVRMRKGTECRHAFDRALQSLPITQHKDIWKLYVSWAKDFGVKETVVRVFRRFLMFDPHQREYFVGYLESIGHFEEAARQLAICLNDDHFLSPQGFTRHQMWMKLCDICANHPEEVRDHLDVEAIIRSGIARFSDEVGRLWCRLADFFTRQGNFEKARDVYEEAINSVTTVRDFTSVFDAYVKVEEGILTAKMRMLNDDDEEEEEEEEGNDGAEDKEKKKLEEGTEIEMRLARIEHLMEKRPLMLNSVVLRQNPNNVFEWHKRIKLLKKDPKRALNTFMEAVKTIDPKQANGRLSGLWIAFASFYETSNDLPSARTVYERATKVNYRSVDELANVWCGWGEMEMRHEQYSRAMAVMQQAVAEPASSARRRRAKAAAQGRSADEDGTGAMPDDAVVADKIHRCVKVWNLYLDLEENLGTIDTCRAAYDRVFELKVVTPQMALNYATFLEERDFFEDSFRVYERAVALFTFPQLRTIWLTYLDKFMERYAGKKLERLRDLFEQAVLGVPVEFAAEFYLKFAQAEEAYGLARHSMAVLDRACRVVSEAEKLDMYRLYAKKVEQHFGITKTRPVYERGIAELSDDQSRALCLEYAELERKLGEVSNCHLLVSLQLYFLYGLLPMSNVMRKLLLLLL